MTGFAEAQTPAADHLLGDYRPPAGVFDELLEPAGEPRPQWSSVLAAFDRLGRTGLKLRWENARRLLREHGVTYNIYGDAQGLERLWELDLVPLVIAPEEWTRIEAGLIQRTRLLNLILADFYGPQRLLREGLLPPALVQANPGFIRPCHGLTPPRGCHLLMHAVDLARSPDGRWWVLADRTQAPSGAGYALENRVILSRLFPDEFQQCRVQRLAGFFQVFRDALHRLAPARANRPNIVLLTPGPYNETYFEHAYLARYLGFPLVEGGDLTVRDRVVFLKTLEGLQRVDVILRRVDDTFCDPLELRADSFLGVAGLLEAARAGNVAIANPLGAGAVEMPALLPFLPALSRALLDEELRLPSVATWWCGQADEFKYVRDHLDRLVVKRAFPSLTGEPVFGVRLAGKERAAVVEAMHAAPQEFVGQEQVALSTAPVWVTDRFEARPLVIRTYVCATEDGFCVMPGGLTRISDAVDDPVVSAQSGGRSKDTWVPGDGQPGPPTLLRNEPDLIRHERAPAEVPSRVADNLFWLGRYAERLEDTVRILRCVLARLVGEAGYEEAPELNALVQLLVRLDLLPSRLGERFTGGGLEREVLLLIYQKHRLGTVHEVLDRLRQIAFVVRDRFSADSWRIFHQLQTDARTRPGRLPAAETLALLNRLLLDLAAFSGMEMENMTRGHGWRFLDIGRRLERAVNVLTLTQAGLAVEAAGESALGPMLEIADSVMTYRRRYFAQPQLATALHLLVADDSNPRSLAFQLRALAQHAANLPGGPTPATGEREQLVRLGDAVDAIDLGAVAGEASSSAREALPGQLAEIAQDLRVFSNALTHRYFSHARSRAS
jgi:uncharacterized circularly permuted ATP-grasp superfamily protein/uncharacterized alpha-E superfamily protein